LVGKYHPDINPGNEKSAGIMQIVNRSYEVLSDPKKRAEHDRWIAEAEYRQPSEATAQNVGAPTFRTEERVSTNRWIIVAGAAIVVVLAVAAILLSSPPGSPQASSTLTPAYATPAPVQNYNARTPETVRAAPGNPAPDLRADPAPEPLTYTTVPQNTQRPVRMVPYRRPPLAPNGQPWPAVSAYLLDQPEDGNSLVTVDNTHNGSDMLVELFDLGVTPATDVRVIFLRAHEQFGMDGARPGTYDLRYQDMDSGIKRKSEPFVLTEHQEQHLIHKQEGSFLVTDIDGTKFSLTLYTVHDGNTQSTIIGPEEFDSSFLSHLPRSVNR
jgi:hypothetical protein